MSEYFGDEFVTFYDNMLHNYYNSKISDLLEPDIEYKDLKSISKDIPKLMKYCNDWFESKKINYSQYADIKKKKKDSIYMNEDQIKEILKYSTYLKLMVPFLYTKSKMKSEHLDKAFSILGKNLSDLDVFRDLFEFVQMILNQYKNTDSVLFDLLKRSINISTGDLIFSIYSSVVNNAIVSLDIDKNPIIFIKVTIESTIKWFLKTSFDKNVVYIDIKNTEEYQNALLEEETEMENTNIDFISDVANEIEIKKFISFIRLNMKRNKIDINNFEQTCSKLNQTPFQLYIIFPILCNILGFDYSFLCRLTPLESYYLQIGFKYVLRSISYMDDYLLAYCDVGTDVIFSDNKKLNNAYKDLNYVDSNINLFNNSDPTIVVKILDNLNSSLAYDYVNLLNGTKLPALKMQKKLMSSLNIILKTYFSEKFEYSVIKKNLVSAIDSVQKEILYENVTNVFDKMV